MRTLVMSHIRLDILLNEFPIHWFFQLGRREILITVIRVIWSMHCWQVLVVAISDEGTVKTTNLLEINLSPLYHVRNA